MDEMIELFSVLNQLQKGALGLFFEMNYFIGCFVTAYIGWFIWNFDAPIANAATIKSKGATETQAFANMYNWLLFHAYFTIFCVLLVIVINCIYRSMNAKAEARGHSIGHSSSKVEEVELQGTAIN